MSLAASPTFVDLGRESPAALDFDDAESVSLLGPGTSVIRGIL